MLNKDEGVVISREEHHRLYEVDDFMDALNAAGVDNWEGYDIAKDILAEWNGEQQ